MTPYIGPYIHPLYAGIFLRTAILNWTRLGCALSGHVATLHSLYQVKHYTSMIAVDTLLKRSGFEGLGLRVEGLGPKSLLVWNQGYRLLVVTVWEGKYLSHNLNSLKWVI